MINIGVIGVGYWGPNLVRNFISLQGCRVVAVADQDLGKREDIKRRYPVVTTYSRGQELLQDTGLEAVAIATPVSTHFELARLALLQGKHVLVEKPLAQTSAQAEELVELANRCQRVLMVGHTYVYSGAVRRIRELVAEGELGDIWYYDSVRANLGLWQPDVNVIWDLAPHDLSILTFTLPQPPHTISAVAACSVACGQNYQECLAYLTLSWPQGTLGHLHLSWLSPIKIRRIILGGSRRMLVYDPIAQEDIQLYDKGVEVGETIHYRQGGVRSIPVDTREPLAVECQHFLDCINEHRQPVSDGQQGLKVVRLLEAAQRSLESGGLPMKVQL